MAFDFSGRLASLRFDLAWLPSGPEEASERDCVAEIGIALDDLDLLMAHDTFSQTVRPTTRLSAYRLASWLASNWWRLRWEPPTDDLGWRMSHEISAIGGGYVWPHIAFASDGEIVGVHARPTFGGAFEPIAYLHGVDAAVAAETFERAVDDIVDMTVARLRDIGHGQDGLAALWEEIREERTDSDATQHRRLEALAGYDPDDIPPALLKELIAVGNAWGRHVADEFAAGLKHASAGIGDALERAATSAFSMPTPSPRSLRVRGNHANRPWERGYAIAEAFRSEAGLGLDPLVAETAAQPQDSTGTPVGLAFRADPMADEIRVSLAKRHPRSRRFELMCLVGGHLARRTADGIIAVTSASTAQQKLQRAFAAEALCPIEGILDMIEGKTANDDFLQVVADRYEVSPMVVEWQLRNRAPQVLIPGRDLAP
ncbi:hypothetical protein [Salinarimonas sp.]|uniref:hypothetical protein n=1 Tax=Salinarimonas sp. TaxID=2766526 RepID=UPI0032D961DE